MNIDRGLCTPCAQPLSPLKCAVLHTWEVTVKGFGAKRRFELMETQDSLARWKYMGHEKAVQRGEHL